MNAIANGDHHDHHVGLANDLPRLLRRRNMLKLLGGGTLLALVGCGSDDDDTAEPTIASTTASIADADAGASCTVIPEETAGPFPGDGSNGPNVLAESGVVRSDIRSSFGSSTTIAAGVPLAMSLVITDTANGCVPMIGAAVYVWHCDQVGRYSLYSDGATGENYLRGLQATDDTGRVTFQSIFPAAYPGRWPHVHFEVYASLDEAISGGALLATSQLALPQDVCELVYATAGYEDSVRYLADTSLQRDGVFGEDGGARQLATTTGDVDAGFVTQLTVPV